MTLSQMLFALLPMLTGVGFLLWYAWGLSAWHSLWAALGMAALPVLILLVLDRRERRT